MIVFIVAFSCLDIVLPLPLRNACLEFWHPLSDHVIVHIGHRLRVFHLFTELKHEVREQGRQGELADHLYERFTDADAAPAKKRREAVRVAPLTARREEVAAFGVEPLGDEALGLDPLGWVVAEAAHHDRDWVTLANLELFTLDVF